MWRECLAGQTEIGQIYICEAVVVPTALWLETLLHSQNYAYEKKIYPGKQRSRAEHQNGTANTHRVADPRVNGNSDRCTYFGYEKRNSGRFPGRSREMMLYVCDAPFMDASRINIQRPPKIPVSVRHVFLERTIE